MDHGHLHRTPIPARMLYEFNFMASQGTKVEEMDIPDDQWIVQLANPRESLNILVKYDPAEYP